MTNDNRPDNEKPSTIYLMPQRGKVRIALNGVVHEKPMTARELADMAARFLHAASETLPPGQW